MGDDLALGDGPPSLETLGEAGDQVGMGSGEVVGFVGVVEEVEELGSHIEAGVMSGVAAEFSVVGEQEFPAAFNDPAIEQAGLGVIEIGDVMGEGLAKDLASGGGIAGAEDGEEIETGEVPRDGNASSGEGGGDDVHAGRQFEVTAAG